MALKITQLGAPLFLDKGDYVESWDCSLGLGTWSGKGREDGQRRVQLFHVVKGLEASSHL